MISRDASARGYNGATSPVSVLLASLLVLVASFHLVSSWQEPSTISGESQNPQQQSANSVGTSTNQFPGVSRELAAFCAGRPSLPVELAAMVVHVKRNVSFNYKLYLWSSEHVFQTGQVVPRDDFRVHSFPVKHKRLADFWPDDVATFTYSGSSLDSMTPMASTSFSWKRFLEPVPLVPNHNPGLNANNVQNSEHNSLSSVHEDILIDSPSSLSGNGTIKPAGVHTLVDRETLSKEDFNTNIEFDSEDSETTTKEHDSVVSGTSFAGDSILPVGSFSSFHVNLTYLVRKDFQQREPQLIRIQLDAGKFAVSQVLVINNGSRAHHEYPQNEDYHFLSHKLLRDTNTRITAINQIYEDWITKNLYTIVYVQRRLEPGPNQRQGPLVNDRLMFRGTSTALIGADQLSYSVKAAAFITEKNGLHYYLEFLPNNRFHLGAIDWSKRPFSIIDSHRIPIKATKTQFDNEELLLCPPAVCYSSQPVDEIVGYGRIALEPEVELEASRIVRLSGAQHQAPGNKTSINGTQINANNLMQSVRLGSSGIQVRLHLRDWAWTLARLSANLGATSRGPPESAPIAGDSSPPESKQHHQHQVPPGVRFGWRYELAKRNDIKAKQDAYGYALTGHEISASYRIYNELYLISANNLIAINYTMPNETVVSSSPIGDEFYGLSSSLLDPITGAFYDASSNRVYFFKGDRYLGYDYATRRPLDEFLVEPTERLLEGALLMEAAETPRPSPRLVATILAGRQHQVDAVYHDQSSGLVYIFSGMLFYTFEAIDFKNGTFQPQSGQLPRMLCINVHFLALGCTFDRAFPNPCRDSFATEAGKTGLQSARLHDTNQELPSPVDTKDTGRGSFELEQQTRLRNLAARSGLVELLAGRVTPSSLGNLMASLSQLEHAANTQRPERMVVYLLGAMIIFTIIITLVMIVLLIHWSREQAKLRESPPANVSQLPEPTRQHDRHRRHHHHHHRLHHHQRDLPSSHDYQVPRNASIVSKGPLGAVVITSRVGRPTTGDTVDSSAL